MRPRRCDAVHRREAAQVLPRRRPVPTRRTELATIFRNANLEIRPLVEAILRDPMFFDPSVRDEPGQAPGGVGDAIVRAAGTSQRRWQASVADNLGQLPVLPAERRGLARRHAVARGRERDRPRRPRARRPGARRDHQRHRHGRHRAGGGARCTSCRRDLPHSLDQVATLDPAQVAAVPPAPRPDLCTPEFALA